MAHFEIIGGNPLSGEVQVSGAKNAALKFLAASLLTDQPITIENMPDIEDVRRMMELLRALGVKCAKGADLHEYTIDPRGVKTTTLDPLLAPKIRVSTLLVAALLVRSGEATLPFPGGCAIGRRPIDLFIRGFEAFGAKVEEQEKAMVFHAKKLHAARFVFPIVSHTVTEALMMMAARIPGETILVNAAMEPEVVALADMLNMCGASITGAGTPTVRIKGVEALAGGRVRVVPDRIEAGSFLALAAATRSELTIRGARADHLEVPLVYLKAMGVGVDVAGDSMRVHPAKKLTAVSLHTHEYPGFPTDLQPPFSVLLTQAHGSALVHETIFEGRLFFTDKLNKMGANIVLCDPHRVIIQGPTPLRGTTLESPDIRAGLALLMAGLVANGKTRLENIYQIDRGYERIEERLRNIGADIKRVG